MFLLFLGLGAVSVRAQVRIGGNAAPNASAVLDLNANDTNSGTKGLALPRVALTSNQMLLPGVTSNLTGMMVYNTSTTGDAGVNTIGIYYWNGATWVRASLPSTSASDSGKVLTSTGYNWTAAYPGPRTRHYNDMYVWKAITPVPVTWNKVADSTVQVYVSSTKWTVIQWMGVARGDLCVTWDDMALLTIWTLDNWITVTSIQGIGDQTVTERIRCYRPSA